MSVQSHRAGRDRKHLRPPIRTLEGPQGVKVIPQIQRIYPKTNGKTKTNSSFFLSFFWPYCMACGILLPQSGIEPLHPRMGAQSLSHWITRAVLYFVLLICLFICKLIFKSAILGNSLVRTQGFHCQGLCSIPDWADKILQAMGNTPKTIN